MIKELVGFSKVIMQQWVGRDFRYLGEGGLVDYKTAKKGGRKRERKERRRQKEESKWP